MLHERFRTHTFTVTRATTRTSDGQGGWVASGSPVGTVTGSLQPASAAETAAADQERTEARWSLYTDPAPGVVVDDVLVGHGRTLRVVVVLEWEATGPADHARVDLVEVQHGR